jgi:hypothetical protein
MTRIRYIVDAVDELKAWRNRSPAPDAEHNRCGELPSELSYARNDHPPMDSSDPGADTLSEVR